MLSRALNLISLLAVALTACSTPAADDLVGATIAKASLYIHTGDFISSPVIDAFSEEELAILEEYRTELIAMIQQGLRRDGVGGALLAAHFKLQENIPDLRWRLFEPGTPYGWEGPDYDSEEDYLTDGQFVYHSVYLHAIEEAAGEPIHRAIEPTERELRVLQTYLENPPALGSPSNRQYYWAKWLARNLQVSTEAR